MQSNVDFTVQNEGSIFLLRPQSLKAQEWVEDNLPDVQPWQMLGNAVAVEHRYIGDIVQGIQNDGLTVA